jgi:hypothetical protein
MTKSKVQIGVAGAVMVGGLLAVFPGMVSASTSPHTFATAQSKLEQQLANRVAQLGRLGADVTASKTLATAHAALLTGSIGAATSSINALVSSVPLDTKQSALNAASATMIKDNRVYAVLTPQVFQTIEADAISSQVVSFQADEATLQSAVNSLVGLGSYKNALNHFVAFTRSVNEAGSQSTSVSTNVLAQSPADFPADTHVFVRANTELLNADVALAHVSYDATVIGLATGGYTGP